MVVVVVAMVVVTITLADVFASRLVALVACPYDHGRLRRDVKTSRVQLQGRAPRIHRTHQQGAPLVHTLYAV